MPLDRRPGPVSPLPPMVRPLVHLVFGDDGKLLEKHWYLLGREPALPRRSR